MSRRLAAILLDRDGTINRKAAEADYITAVDQVELLPGAATAIRRLNQAGVPVVVVTNQRGIALGRMTEGDLSSVHDRLGELLAEQQARLDAIFHCPHGKDACECRKPGVLLLRRAQAFLGLDTLEDCVMIGDAETDVLAGQRAGAQSILLAPEGTVAPAGARVTASLASAVDELLAVPA